MLLFSIWNVSSAPYSYLELIATPSNALLGLLMISATRCLRSPFPKFDAVEVDVTFVFRPSFLS